ncbi:metal-dependent phosphohydrolase [Micromonospora sp. NBRC 107095]|uniref:HD domain-containing protein n=1 Tax=Micromonospora sp. NBRC 107095 TaxID=3032209 RepID=UPI0025556C8E|nr:metal-dependent phosphohydrolase [Micromonospora sp. NBRC 107095]
MADLLDRWRAAARDAGAGPDPDTTRAGEMVIARWREPHRHYHTLAHLTAALDVVDQHADLAERVDVVRLAAWFHDVVYDPRAAGDANERDSATLAGNVLAGLGVPMSTVAEVRRLVLLTAGHSVTPDDRDGALLCDADLAVLAAPPARYERYAAAIRREYAHVPEPAFRAGRAAVLTGLLALPALFRLPPLASRWEEPARANVRRELATLSGEPQNAG